MCVCVRACAGFLSQRIFPAFSLCSSSRWFNASSVSSLKALFEIGVHVDKAAINELYLSMASENVDTISFYEYVIFMCTLKANDLAKHPELLSTVGEKHAENHVKHNCCAMISGRRKKKTKEQQKICNMYLCTQYKRESNLTFISFFTKKF